MNKRILSWLLVFAMLLGLMPAAVFATETPETSQAPVKSGEDISISMELNDWYDLDLSGSFTAEDGGELTYSSSTDGEAWTALSGSAYRYYPAGDGQQTMYFRAEAADGSVSETLTLTADVREVPSQVTVKFSVTQGPDGFYQGGVNDAVMVPTEITVPYFDLALYDLADYYYNPQCYATADGNLGSGTTGDPESAEGVVTVLHVFIYATEVLYLGYNTRDAGKGLSYDSGEFQDVLSWTGSGGSTYMYLWDHGSNLNYYVDWEYPLGAPQWGSTADQIALYGGEDISIHMIESTSAHGSNFSFFTNGGLTPAAQVEELTVYQGEVVNLTAVETQPDWEGFLTTYQPNETELYWIESDAATGDLAYWNSGSFANHTDGFATDAEGKIAIDTATLTPGTYYIAAEGNEDKNLGTETGSAIVKLTVKAQPQDVTVTVTQNDAEVAVYDTGLLYSDTKVYFAEVPEYGSFVFTDDLTEKLGTANRYFGYRNALPYTCGVDNYQTKKDYNTIVNRYGEIEGLTAENTKLHAIEVSAVAANGWGRGALQYVLVVEIPVIRVESVTLDQTEVATWGGNQVQLTATVAPGNASFPTVTWTSDNTQVAQVSSTGLVSCWLDGTATITATADGVSASCTITVVDGVPVPTVVYSGNGWPINGNQISKITAQKVQVTNTMVNGSNYYISLSEDTAADALMTLEIVTSGSSGVWVRVDGENLNETVNAATFLKDFQLADGSATVVVRAMPYWDDPNSEAHWNSYGATKTFYFSNTGTFPMAPLMAGGTSTTALAAEGDSYSIDLAPLFKEVSDSETTYQVSVNGAEAEACDAAYTYTCDTTGTIKLVFNAVNDYGVSPNYTATLTVVPEEAIHEVNYEVDGGVIEWFAFTDAQMNPLPEGTTYTWDAENLTWTIVQPTDIDKAGKVMTFYKLVKDNPSSTLPCLTGSSQTAGAGTHWNGAIRFQQTDTLSYGFKAASVYLAETGGYSPKFSTIRFNYERALPDTAFEYKIEDGPAKYTLKGDNGGVVGHSWISTGKNNEVHVALTEETPNDALIYCEERAVTTTLTDGAGTYTYKTGSWFWGDEKTWTIKYQKDQFPVMNEGVETIVDVTVPCLDEYTVDLSAMFTDPDADDTLTYEVRIDGGAWTKIEGSSYTYIPETAQNYTLEFRCYDGFVYAADTHTVNITSTNSTQLYSVTVNVDGDAKFYCFTSVAEDGTVLYGDAIASADNGDGSYKLGVPMNVRRVVAKIGEAVAVVDVDPDNTTATLHKVVFSAQTFGGDEADATYTVTGTAEIQPIGDGNVFYLIPGTYTFTATPAAGFSELWAAVTLTEQTVDAAAEVKMVLPVRAAKTITVDKGAELKVFYQRGYYVMSEVEPVVIVENDNLTTTYYYSCPKAQAYSMGYMYFATNGDLIDKAGYLMGTSETTITWRGDGRTGDYRAEYDVNYGQGSRGDDSVLVNVNAQNHLVLNEGETFRLRSSRIWEIINTDTENVMIEPTYVYGNYDESIITLTNANEVLTDRVCGTGGNNWMDITVTGSGVTFLEVGYEAVHLVDGYTNGAWGGAGAAADNFTWNAIDPDRTALIVVQTDGMAATDVSFGIDCLSSNIDGTAYDPDKAVAWDAEFDTLYFLGAKGTMTLSPSAKEGTIVSVAVSADKGESWTELTAKDGVYTADIYPGNNIIRVTKDDGTTAYQLVRGDKVTAQITLVNDRNSDGEAGLGDTVRVTLNGLHNPVGKMSGIYNPGFSKGQRLTYTWNGATAQQAGYYQYDFVSNAWIEVTIPETAASEYVLTDGYIHFNVFGDGPGNHRNLTDSGRGVNTSAASSLYTRSLLPEIVVYSCDHDYTEKGAVVEATCTADGYTEYVCADCGHTYRENWTPAVGHDYTTEVTEATCTSMGYTTYTCAKCGESHKDGFVDALGHSYGEGEVTEATCTTAGYTTYTCAACGNSYMTGLAEATGHSYEDVVTEPTHEKMGYTTHTCADCGHSCIDAYTDALGHDYVSEITKEATCTAEGEMTFTCSCGESYTQVLPKTDHECETVTVEPGCESYGYVSQACVHCDYASIVSISQPTGHTETVVGRKDAGYHADGCTGDTVCADCGELLVPGETVPALGCPSVVYSDVQSEAWFHDAVDYVTAKGIMNGMGDGMFAPNAPTNRAMMAVLLYRLAGEPSVEGLENPFTDVEAGSWFHDAVVWAANAGIVNGKSADLFAPADDVTREQMVTMLYRWAGSPETSLDALSAYTDADTVSAYAKAAFAWAIESGVVTGVTETTLAPTVNTNRAQVAVILMRYLEK